MLRKTVQNALKIAPVAGLAAMGAACMSTAPDGKGSLDANGKERKPSEMLAVGEQAPDFTALDEDGNTVRLADFRNNRNVVLVFYPGNDTPGCNKQLCSIRDDWSAFVDSDTQVFGVNPAAAESHRSFSDKFSFPFPLIADTDGAVVRAYGCRGLGGITTRTVYVIDKEGTIVFAQRGMPSTQEILAAVPKG